MIEQAMFFWQEWGVVVILFLLVVGLMVVDLFPKMAGFMRAVEGLEQLSNNAVGLVFSKQKYVIDCYEQLPVRIKAGFALIGGKSAWAGLVKWMYKYLRKRVIKE